MVVGDVLVPSEWLADDAALVEFVVVGVRAAVSGVLGYLRLVLTESKTGPGGLGRWSFVSRWGGVLVDPRGRILESGIVVASGCVRDGVSVSLVGL
jgi:hypothetical protein